MNGKKWKRLYKALRSDVDAIKASSWQLHVASEGEIERLKRVKKGAIQIANRARDERDRIRTELEETKALLTKKADQLRRVQAACDEVDKKLQRERDEVVRRGRISDEAIATANRVCEERDRLKEAAKADTERLSDFSKEIHTLKDSLEAWKMKVHDIDASRLLVLKELNRVEGLLAAWRKNSQQSRAEVERLMDETVSTKVHLHETGRLCDKIRSLESQNEALRQAVFSPVPLQKPPAIIHNTHPVITGSGKVSVTEILKGGAAGGTGPATTATPLKGGAGGQSVTIVGGFYSHDADCPKAQDNDLEAECTCRRTVQGHKHEILPGAIVCIRCGAFDPGRDTPCIRPAVGPTD